MNVREGGTVGQEEKRERGEKKIVRQKRREKRGLRNGEEKERSGVEEKEGRQRERKRRMQRERRKKLHVGVPVSHGLAVKF